MSVVPNYIQQVHWFSDSELYYTVKSEILGVVKFGKYYSANLLAIQYNYMYKCQSCDYMYVIVYDHTH